MKARVPILECSVCETPWVLRVTYRLDFRGPEATEPFEPVEWLYARDCKCREPGKPTHTKARPQVRGTEAEPATAPLTVLDE